MNADIKYATSYAMWLHGMKCSTTDHGNIITSTYFDSDENISLVVTRFAIASGNGARM